MNLFFRKKNNDENNDFFDIENDIPSSFGSGEHLSPTALTPEELLNNEKKRTEVSASGVSPLEALKKKMTSGGDAPDDAVAAKNADTHKSLLEKCHAYTVDEEGIDHAINEEPLYQLESVAEILREDSERAMKMLSEKYDISFHDLKSGKISTSSEKEPEPPQEETEKTEEPKLSSTIEAKKGSPTPAFEKMVQDSKSKPIQKELLDDMISDVVKLADIDTSLPDISDIDTKVAEKAPDKAEISNTATIKFTPVKDQSNTGRISISSTTKLIDIGGEFEDISSQSTIHSSETELEQNEFEEYEAVSEPTTINEAKKLLRKLAINKRNHFLRSIFSVLFTLAVTCFLIPPLSYSLIRNTDTAMTVCLCFFGFNLLVNYDMFIDFKNIFSKRCNTGVAAALNSLIVLAFGISAVLTSNNGQPILLLGSLILTFRAISSFFDASALHGNLKQITVAQPKKAVTLIDDTAVTYAMAKKSIEGDALIATSRSTDFISDYMKHSTFGAKLNGRIPLLVYIALFAAIITGAVAYSYYDGIYYALYCAASVACVTLMPSLFLIDSLPLFSAAAKFNKRGAMIAGKTAAEKLEQANAVVLSSTDLFPDGTVTLQNIKVLSDNNIDDTIMRAASLTEAVGSTLAPIFKKIAKTNDTYSLPDSDTVKYEDRLGLSGWVDNELLFIGNRTLMEAHGIAVPNVEFDRRILRQGFFPVYLASGDKACAVIIIQYDVDPEVAREMRRLTELGITALINNTDPNINESMICDYLGLYEDSVKIMSNAGVYMHKNATVHTEKCSAPAAFRGGNLRFVSIINAASRIKRSNMMLSVAFAILAVFGVLMFIYTAFSGTASLLEPTTVLLYCVISAIISLILFLFKKP